MEDNARSNSAAILFELAEQIETLFRRSTDEGVACGRLLLKAREIANHGGWLPFPANAGMPARTAQRLMRVADYVGDCEVKCDTLSHLGISRTLDFLRARDRAMAAWRAACQAEPDNHDLIQNPPGCPLSGLMWCDDPNDRAVLAEVAARLYEIDLMQVLDMVLAETA